MLADTANHIVIVIPDCPFCGSPLDPTSQCPTCAACGDRANRTRIAEARELHRLARSARAGVVRTHRRPGTVESYYATDPSLPADVLLLTGFSCTCGVFVRHGRCRHHAALLDFLDWLPPLPCSCDAVGYVAIANGVYEACSCAASHRLGSRRHESKAVIRG